MKTAVVNIQQSEFEVYIGREYRSPQWYLAASKWANPFHIGKDGTRAEVVAKYEDYIRSRPDLMTALPELKGKRLGCWCVGEPINYVRDNPVCHGEILLKLLLKQAGQAD